MDSKISTTFIFENGVTQHINMSQEAYNYMTSDNEVPRRMTPSMWKKMPLVKKLEHHLSLLKEDLHAVDVSYKIMKSA